MPEHAEPKVYDETFWNEMYNAADSVWSGNANPQLVTEATGLTPGRALDVGSGEGADALWLAERGWQVTAVDLSSVALRRAETAARRLGAEIDGRVDWVHADVLEWVPPRARFDLVSAQFMQLADPVRTAVYTRLAEAVVPGGTLLVVGHHPSMFEGHSGHEGHGDHGAHDEHEDKRDRMFTAEDIAAVLDPGQWTILAAETRSRPGRTPDGGEGTLYDAVLRACRLG